MANLWQRLFRASKSENPVPVLRQGRAARVVFFYPGEEGTYIEDAEVTVFANGAIHLKSKNEETTAHLQNCEILWSFNYEGEERSSKVRLLHLKDSQPKSPSGPDNQPPEPEPPQV